MLAIKEKIILSLLLKTSFGKCFFINLFILFSWLYIPKENSSCTRNSDKKNYAKDPSCILDFSPFLERIKHQHMFLSNVMNVRHSRLGAPGDRV